MAEAKQLNTKISSTDQTYQKLVERYSHTFIVSRSPIAGLYTFKYRPVLPSVRRKGEVKKPLPDPGLRGENLFGNKMA